MFHNRTISGTCASVALASSGRVNCRPPSPIRQITGARSSMASALPNQAPMAAGKA
ncbi:hypothetical protein D3C76_1146630 [compost metagenome]